MKTLSHVMRHTAAYRLWQAPFAEKKLAPVLQHNDLSSVRSVLDVGCGPGTNTRHFAKAAYLGLDVNPDYIAYARNRYGRNFVATDVREYSGQTGEQFDFILVNSFFHHIDDNDSRRIMANLSALLMPAGAIHIVDLVMPKNPGPARLLAKADRGDYPRGLEKWFRIFSESFEPTVFEPYSIGLLGVTLWNMVYFRGSRKE
jgi:SAM-dependent methyltransferase